MRVAVIGAGVIGVTSAYELAADGHEVTVFERRGSVAVEASFAHAGLIAPGVLEPWAAPGRPAQLLRSLFGREPMLHLRPGGNAASPRWLWRWWRACAAPAHRLNRARMQRLALYSRERLQQLTRRLKLDYERADGHLVLWRTARDQALMEPALALLGEQGLRFTQLDAAGCLGVEPGLNPATGLHGGVHFQQDEVGNCRQFALMLRGEAEKLGAEFKFHATVQRIEPGRQPRVTYLHSPHDDTTLLSSSDTQRTPAFQVTEPLNGPETDSFDAVLVCAAMGAPALLAPIGLKLPLAAVHGYSVTTPLRQHEAHPDLGPRSTVTDQARQVNISRLGSRIRISGGSRLGGTAQGSDPDELAQLYQVLDDWFPGAGRLSQAQRWKGARPSLPDGPPVMGASGLPGIWLNLGHGAAGWAMACGSARVLADTLAGRSPGIDLDGLGIERLRH